MIRTRNTWALVLVLCAGLWACGDGNGSEAGTGGTGGENTGGTGGENPGGTGGNEPTDPVCGNGEVEQGEECDDGNRDDGDGCDSNCQLEPVGACDGALNFFVESSYDPPIRTAIGTIEAGDSGRLEGSCGGEGPERVYKYQTSGAGLLIWLVANPEITAPVSGITSYLLPSSCDEAGELACIVDSDLAEIEIPEAGEYYIVIDSVDPLGADFDFSIQTIFVPYRKAGESCDPRGQDDMCVPGLVCKGTPATCQEGTAPVITRAAFYQGGDPSYFIAEGTDEEEDIVAFSMEALDANGQPMNAIDTDLNGTYDGSQITLSTDAIAQATWGMTGVFGNGDGTWFALIPTYWSVFGIPFVDPTAPVETLRVVMIDSAMLESAPFDVKAPAIIPENGACDNDGFVVCDEGLLCKGDPMTCQPGTPPVIEEAIFGERPDGEWVLVFRGVDVDDDLTIVRFERLDEEGNVLPIDEQYNEIDLAMETEGDTTFFGYFYADAELSAPQIRLTAIDSLGMTSEPFVVTPAPIPVKAEGEACSPDGWDACVSGLVCWGEEDPVCTDLRAETCEAAPVIDATGPGTWSIEGTVALPSLWEGPDGCSLPYSDPRGMPEGIVVLRLANDADKVIISTVNDVTNSGIGYGDTVLYVSPGACGGDDFLGCNDDVDGEDWRSMLELHDVAAGDYTIVIDTWDRADDGGAFQVDVTVQ